MSHLSLDARAILEYLNELGYRNISAEQLKEFLKDLRKLIKYEENIGINANQDDYFESLFRRTTASYRAKVDKENAQRHMNENMQRSRGNTEVRQALRSQSQERNKVQKQPAQGSAANKAPEKNKIAPMPPNDMNERSNGSKRFLGFRERNSVINTLATQPVTSATNGNVPAFTHLRAISLHPKPQSVDNFGQRSIFESNISLRLQKSATQRSSLSLPQTYRLTSAVGGKPAGSSSGSKQLHPMDPNEVSPNSGRNMHSFAPSRSKSTTQRVSATETKPTPRSAASVMIPDRCAVNRRHRPLSHDPVALYHYYRSEWRHFQDQIPGENSHAELRWRVRNKLLNPH